jgi:aldehyde dehydrogenase (NAD+)
VLKGIEICKESGIILTRGERKGTTGCYVQPTIFVNVEEDSKLWREEVYSPVVLIKSFKTEQDAIRMGNDTEYRLAAQIFTRDIVRALRVSRKMDVVVVTINSSGRRDN